MTGPAKPATVRTDRTAPKVRRQDAPLAGILPGADGGGDPELEPAQALVAVGQRADGDQDAAQVGEGLARGQVVEDLVSQPAAVAAEAGKKAPHSHIVMRTQTMLLRRTTR
jgi:hypothetical protein